MLHDTAESESLWGMVITILLLWGWREEAVASSVGTKERTCSMMGDGGLIPVTQLRARSRPVL